MTYTPNPNHMRAPHHLSTAELQQALEELDSKIKTLHARANATTADSPHHYHEHIAALEVKRHQLSEQLGAADRASTADDDRSGSVWTDLRRGIDTLREDISKLF
jgi:chromosome segregation ATPase